VFYKEVSVYVAVNLVTMQLAAETSHCGRNFNQPRAYESLKLVKL
jgi:hypothetical protein